MPARPVDLSRLLGLAKYLLPILVVALCALAWYWDRIAYAFAHRPGPGDIAGAWTIDADAFARLAEDTSRTVPAGPLREKYLHALLARGDAYRDVVYTFSASGYAVRRATGTEECPATYEGYPPDTISVRPEHGSPIAILVAEPGRRLLISLPVLGIPLKPAG